LLQREVPAHANATVEIWAFDGASFADRTVPRDSSKDHHHPVRVNMTLEGLHTSQRPSGTQWLAKGWENATLLDQSALAIRYIDDRYVAIRADPHGTLALFDIDTDEIETRTYKAGRPSTDKGQRWIESLAISHNRREPLLATGAGPGTLDLWAIQDRTLVQLQGPEELGSPGPRLDFVPLPGDEARLLTGDSRGTLGLLAVAGRRLRPARERWQAHIQPITAVAATVDADGQVLALAGDLGGLVTLWRFAPDSIPAGPAMQVQLGSRVVSLAFTGPREFIAWCKQGGAVLRWNAG
jgi:hypothetical protein